LIATTARRVCCIGLLAAALTFAGSSASLAATGGQASAAAAGIATTSDTSVSFTGFGNGPDERSALADAERDARQQAADQGFTDCKVVFTNVGIPIVPGGSWSAVVIIECVG
jgi:ABC-type glycerol-3-phosphate transport system substrate-binding protein